VVVCFECDVDEGQKVLRGPGLAGRRPGRICSSNLACAAASAARPASILRAMYWVVAVEIIMAASLGIEKGPRDDPEGLVSSFSVTCRLFLGMQRRVTLNSTRK
jgi:hypothetical protein